MSSGACAGGDAVPVAVCSLPPFVRFREATAVIRGHRVMPSAIRAYPLTVDEPLVIHLPTGRTVGAGSRFARLIPVTPLTTSRLCRLSLLTAC